MGMMLPMAIRSCDFWLDRGATSFSASGLQWGPGGDWMDIFCFYPFSWIEIFSFAGLLR
jgi:hypothetical protein